MVWAKILFWLAIGWVVYANVGYLLLLWLVARVRAATRGSGDTVTRRLGDAETREGSALPTVSLMVAARNEEKVIAAKLENSLALEYPAGQLQVLVASDGSTDGTDEIVRGFAERGVVLNHVDTGLGKVNALNETLPLAAAEIVVISDADSAYAPDALGKLVRHFSDSKVGAVTGEERRVPAAGGEGAGEGFYARLDNRIKRLEGELGGMVMVNGGFFAIRRALYPLLAPHLIHDSIVPCRLVLEGYRTAYEPDAVSVETYALDAAGDFRRRLRTVIQAFYSYLAVPQALNPFRTGWFAVKLFSHRFTRWFVFPALVVALVTSAALAAGRPLYLVLLAAQLACYALALAGWLMDRRGKKVPVFYFPYYFVYIHLAAFVAVAQALLGKRVATWIPTERGAPA